MNIKLIAAAVSVGAALVFTGCSKEEEVHSNKPMAPRSTVTLDNEQVRTVAEAVKRIPKLRFYNPNTNKFIDLDFGTREFEFADPADGFNFADADNDGTMYYTDNDGSYLVFSVGGGTSSSGGSGVVVAGETTLNMDYVVCLAAEQIEADGESPDIFDTGFEWDEFGLVLGFSGDFEALADADTESDDFDPFEYFNGYAAYYVISDELVGSYDIFDWFAFEEGDDSANDFAFSFVMDFSNLNLYFASDGELSVSNSGMSFDGTYLVLSDFFDAFLDGEEAEDPTFEEVDGFGQMGCN
jgi:hypothetical protein